MDERLTQEQRELVEENLTVIDSVIKSCVHVNNNICGMEYDDLYQIGAIGLCKAASRYKQCKQAAFSTYDVFIGKNDTKEIDFVAIRRDEKIYVQVCVQLPEKSDREVGNLMEIKDHYPKYVVTLNDLDVGIENGIKIVHLSDFLLSSQW